MSETAATTGRAGRWLRLPAGLLLVAVVFLGGGVASQAAVRPIPESPMKMWLSMTLFQLTMGLLALGIMLLLGRGRLQRFGFRRGAPLPLSRVLLTVLVAEVPILVAFLPFVRPGAEHFVADFSFWQIVVGVWIVASTTEEIVVRGLFQSYLEPLSSVRLAAGRLAVSLPVVAGALLFAAMHLPLLALGIDPVLGAEILVMTLALGLIAGHFREVTGSLLPAIVAHSFANITGMGAETLSRALGL